MFKWFERLLEKIAKANGDNFKGQKLDCCELNKKGSNGGANK
ncbi:MAG: hypothetical protein PWR27_157 [Petroclostridium sp.]|nr:LDCC motif putative metal-binding protein [Petroclostridium xylanilyticum]MBZ4646998.1 hypothetical protein [Clostridia bacterium]MDK2809448.1 hypothetical protein [Petroclostridium sp.]